MKVRQGTLSTLAGGQATVAAADEQAYITAGLRVPAWLQDAERYPQELLRVGDAVAYVEFLDGSGLVLGRL